MKQLLHTIVAFLVLGLIADGALAASKKSKSKAAIKARLGNVKACADKAKDSGWQKINDDAYFRKGCARLGSKEYEFTSVAFHMSKHDMSLVGSAESGALPTLKEISAAQRDASATYSLRSSSLQKDRRLVTASIGYPQSDELFDLAGFARIDGKDVSERDDIAEFKSAFLCLNEVKKNQSGGSRTVVFNAFERGLPVTMNARAEDEENCPDLIQVGPRIVEYRAERGIKTGSKPQNWLIFSQGNGPEYYGYITFMETPTDLFGIQELLLKEGFLGKFDKNMRVAVALTSGRHSSLTIDTQQVGGPLLLGQTSKKHPVFLTVEPSATGSN